MFKEIIFHFKRTKAYQDYINKYLFIYQLELFNIKISQGINVSV